MAGSLAHCSEADRLLINHSPSVLHTLPCPASPHCYIISSLYFFQSHIPFPLPAAHCHSPLQCPNLQLGLLENSAMTLHLHSLHFSQPATQEPVQSCSTQFILHSSHLLKLPPSAHSPSLIAVSANPLIFNYYLSINTFQPFCCSFGFMAPTKTLFHEITLFQQLNRQVYHYHGLVATGLEMTASQESSGSFFFLSVAHAETCTSKNVSYFRVE